jgi:hypothetical protein
MIQVFIEYLDSLYFEGYTLQLSFQNPQAYKFELKQFLKNYNLKK